MKLGNKLKELRNDKGLTQEELADRLAMSRRQYIKYETGQLIPPHGKIKALNRLFKTDLYKFL